MKLVSNKTYADMYNQRLELLDEITRLNRRIELLERVNNMWKGTAVASLSMLGLILFGLLLSPIVTLLCK